MFIFVYKILVSYLKLIFQMLSVCIYLNIIVIYFICTQYRLNSKKLLTFSCQCNVKMNRNTLTLTCISRETFLAFSLLIYWTKIYQQILKKKMKNLHVNSWMRFCLFPENLFWFFSSLNRKYRTMFFIVFKLLIKSEIEADI